MIAPIDFNRFEQALTSVNGWIELVLAVVCIASAWWMGRQVVARGEALPINPRLRSSITRVGPPMFSLVVIYVVSAIWARFVGPPLFLAIAKPVIVALVVIRMTMYALGRLFPTQEWLPAWELPLGATAWGLVILYLTGVLPEIGAALDDLVIPFGKSRVSLLTIFAGIAVIVVTLVVTLWLSGFIEQRLARATHLDASLRVVMSKVIRAVLIVLGSLIALEQVGFDITLLTVFSGAVGVGIGLGLQKLASNYIAGFAILLDRSVHPGDLITVDNRTGVVAKTTSRYVVVRGGDGVEAIVPNETLVTTTVLNQTYSTHEVRVALQVLVTYDSDVQKALGVMNEIALRQPRVMRGDRAPLALLVNFAESGVLLELGVWISDPHVGYGLLKSEMGLAILKEFAVHGIRIPLPQREVRVVDGRGGRAGVVPDPVEVANEDKNRSKTGVSGT